MSAKISLRLLQIVLGVVLCLYCAELVIAQPDAAHHDLAFFAFLILGGVQAVTALVFLFAASMERSVPLATFAASAAIHTLLRQAGHNTADLHSGGGAGNGR
jgi:Na+/melibiose symporter-like transporter